MSDDQDFRLREIIVGCLNTDYSDLVPMLRDYPRGKVLGTIAEMCHFSSYAPALRTVERWKKNAKIPASW